MPLPGSSPSLSELPNLQYDRDAVGSFVLDIPPTGRIPLQFPPKITSEGKSANWQEDMFYGYEEYARWMGSRARKLNIEIDFVVWGTWDQDKIRSSVRDIKKHLYVSGQGVEDKVPFMFISGWQVIKADGRRPAFRLMDVDIQYSKEMVGSGNDYWPLKTTVKLGVKLFTMVGSIGEEAPKYTENIFGGRRIPPIAAEDWS